MANKQSTTRPKPANRAADPELQQLLRESARLRKQNDALKACIKILETL
jgi:hypothetical protein